MGYLARLFGSRDRSANTMTLELATRIVRDYGATLVSAAPPPGCVVDSRYLPHPKDSIKQAIVIALSFTSDQQMRDELKDGYISLADWQDNVGDKPVGLDVSGLEQSANTAELASEIVARGAEIAKFIRLVQQEQATLKAELQELRV